MTEESSFLDRSWREFARRLYGPSREGLSFGLDRIERALEIEGRPDRSAPAVLVAGTNGKGGTAAHLAGMLQQHGRRVGLFTSPHLIDVRERFRVDGRPIGRDVAREVGKPLVEAYGARDASHPEGEEGADERPELTFFELTALMAASIFEHEGVDVAIYEVGMGGRLDATNAFDPTLSIVTSIDFDHQMFLGETIEEIAREKCGILRTGVPAVVGPQRHDGARRTLSERLAGEQVRWARRDFEVDGRTGRIRVGEATIAPFEGERRAEVTQWNAATAAQGARVLLEGSFDPSACAEGIRRTRWPGRDDRRVVEPEGFGGDRPVDIWLDAAHNPGAVRELLGEVADSDLPLGGIVVGGMADKELGEMFERLAGGPPVWGAEIGGARAARGAGLESIIPDGVRRGIGPLEDVLPRALRSVSRGDGASGLLVFGSSYLVGAALEEIGVEADDLVTFEPAAGNGD